MLADDQRLLYGQDAFPILQNRTYETVDGARACPRGDIRLVENLTTGLVYNAAFRPELVVYDRKYQNEQSGSARYRNHLETVSTLVLKHLGRTNLVEIGCGKGFFLEMLLQKAASITGFDPAYEGNNPHIRPEYFRGFSDDRADGIILRHVLEHIQNPYEFLCTLRDENGGGRIYIEVPCFDWICRQRAWFDVFYEHVNYFRMADFHRMFEDVIAGGHLFSGQYLYVVADLAGLRAPQATAGQRVEFPGDFAARLDTVVHDRASGGVVWGGASRGVIFSLLCERAGRPVDRVIDINPAKQGNYLPATGLAVRSPAEGLKDLPRGTDVYVMNMNYIDEIREASKNLFHYVGFEYD